MVGRLRAPHRNGMRTPAAEPVDVELSLARPEALDDPARREDALALLTDAERERVGRFHFERDRRLHLAARALLRRSLSRWSEVPPAEWRFEADARGRPEIAAPRSPLRFNVSHTRGLALVGVTVDRDVGVDVEGVPAAVPLDVVDRCFSPGERAALHAAPPGARPARFAELWTLKEAYVKARGAGLALPLDAFAFGLDPPRLLLGDDPSAWQLELLTPTAVHRAALCARDRRPIRVGVRWDDLSRGAGT
jgi:4'-phosphopantetheinyl transferase